MFRKNWQQRIKFLRRFKTNARFYRKRHRHRVAQRAENRVNARWFAQQSAARALAINNWRGTTEIQINRGDGKLLQQLCIAHERGNIVADHLRDDGFTGGIFGDGIENPFFRPRIAMDAKIFRPINFRPAVAVNDAHELQRRHVLHRRERGEWRIAAQQLEKCFGRRHDDSQKITSARRFRCRAFPILASKHALSNRTAPNANRAWPRHRLSAPDNFRRTK